MSGFGENWYDAFYADDPAPDNIFGRETLRETRNPLLHEYLRLGGRLCDLALTLPAHAKYMRISYYEGLLE